MVTLNSPGRVLPQWFSPFVNKSPVSNLFSAAFNLDREELSTKVDEANQTIGALGFKNNFLAERTKMLEAELFQVRAQLERTSSAKLDEMLSF